MGDIIAEIAGRSKYLIHFLSAQDFLGMMCFREMEKRRNKSVDYYAT
mgnify:CR=1 FL=1